ncbi:PhoU family transcriptional regulator [Halarcobacter ebronensis]|uniref:PhoU family transcriptional regulator n=1 Tax=Halarcobacter ebronensis TaxID=1462615 RepID=A0A4Q0YDJ2_9BACT|nr:PhoU domain-containing protein [Halarcobacter ebronensis]RXJ68537.1 PhoU family transcriptional regulator [Halarcobacter ebronensis]
MLKKYATQLEDVNSGVLEIANSILNSNRMILKAFSGCKVELLKEAEESLKSISQKVADIDNIIIKTLALFGPEATDLRFVVSFFKITNELQRASSNTRSFIKSFEVYCNNISEEDTKEYAIPLHKSSLECLESAVKMIECSHDEVRENFNNVIVAEKKTDELYNQFQDYILSQDKKIEDFSKYTEILNALRKNEKIADRALDIAYLILFARVGGVLGEVEI